MILTTKGTSNNTMFPHCYNAQKVEFISVKRNLFPPNTPTQNSVKCPK